MIGRGAIRQAPWRLVASRRSAARIKTYLSDGSEKHRQPHKLSMFHPRCVVIRVFDKLAVDLKRLVDRFGDYSQAAARCDDCLRKWSAWCRRGRLKLGDGLVVDGGVGLIRAAAACKAAGLKHDERTGYKIVLRARRSPLTWLCQMPWKE